MRQHRKHRWIPSINPYLLICSKKEMGLHGWQLCSELAPKNPGVFFSRLGFVFEDTHLCLSSPTGLCSYNTIEDPAHDYCIYCHQPYERK